MNANYAMKKLTLAVSLGSLDTRDKIQLVKDLLEDLLLTDQLNTETHKLLLKEIMGTLEKVKE